MIKQFDFRIQTGRTLVVHITVANYTRFEEDEIDLTEGVTVDAFR